MNIEKTKVTHILRAYRYTSLVLTAVFYMIGTYEHSVGQRIMVTLGMCFTTGIIDYLYIQNKESRRRVLVLVALEMIGNCLLLVLSGGVDSPYVWYMINTVFMSGLSLGTRYLWGSVGIYIVSMGFLAHYKEPYNWMSPGHLNIIAGFILGAVAIQLLLDYAKALEEKREKAEQYLNYAMEIYDTVYIVAAQKDEVSLVNVILNYITERLKSDKVLIVLEEGESVVTYKRGFEALEVDELVGQIQTKKRQHTLEKDVMYGENYIGVPIKYAYDNYGVILLEGRKHEEALWFLAYISSMILKKIALESMNNELILSQEQNRIANEIHDSVLQKLFGVSCNVYMMTNRLEQMDQEMIRTELQDVRRHITEAMTELRQTIYGLSWNKEGNNSFISKLEAYMISMKSLHSVKIEMQLVGEVHRLGIDEQKVIYRVCCESVSNGIRHGKAKVIRIKLQVNQEEIVLEVEDDGCGFDYEEVMAQGLAGLGLKNIRQLIESLGGILEVDSKMGKGTRISANIK